MSALAEPAIAFAGLLVAGFVAARVGQSMIPAFVVAGLVLGPSGFALVSDGPLLRTLAELGVVLLLFFMGLEFSLRRLTAGGRRTAYYGLVNLAFNFPLGVALGLLFGWDLLTSVFLGLVVYVTSSGILVKTVIELRRVANRETETALVLSITEDIFTALFLAVVAAVATVGTSDPARLAVALGASLGFCFLFIVLSRVGQPWLHRLSSMRSEELFLLLLLALVLVVALGAQAVGLSGAIGAFFLGLAFADVAQVGRIKAKVVPLRDVFVGLFFFSFGMVLDLSALPEVAWMLLLAVPLTMATKFATGLAIGGASGETPRGRVNLATALLPRGEFSIVAAGIAIAYGLNPALAAFTGFYVVITAVVGTILMSKSGFLTEILVRNGHLSGKLGRAQQIVGYFRRSPFPLATRFKF
ncbi:MAG TPA: cation:proton antiporter [Candidatus Thermoplasmatota archaeon]|nr:cation:proton antiporter [Candidatus Thermoplasmatota archaeon]